MVESEKGESDILGDFEFGVDYLISQNYPNVTYSLFALNHSILDINIDGAPVTGTPVISRTVLGGFYPRITLRILARYDAKIAKICIFLTLWPVIQLICHLSKFQKKMVY